ncbi:hypothetical protein HYPSUDRAFT_326371 [Hypholoma sublateritium FD-334 SS-4]|uniref:Uncharacterized protein n=1 Tax=Hypholoma sublateritium (strain FD-334 SS-4) TaxID=945553 RepID=A0A0D2KN63_HYPSF|nr:hypothetical protein HYPSUDRAFT_326371 [Hypholoma sublateritium FD-334 SS-4]
MCPTRVACFSGAVRPLVSFTPTVLSPLCPTGLGITTPPKRSNHTSTSPSKTAAAARTLHSQFPYPLPTGVLLMRFVITRKRTTVGFLPMPHFPIIVPLPFAFPFSSNSLCTPVLRPSIFVHRAIDLSLIITPISSDCAPVWLECLRRRPLRPRHPPRASPRCCLR